MPTTQHARVRVGIAGLGFGTAVHLPGCRAIEGVEVVALLGRCPERANEVAQQTGLPVETNLEAWFDHNFDAVTVALPPRIVFPVVCAALERNIPVLCEKPLGNTSAEADVLMRRAMGLTTAVDFQFAELEAFRELRTRLASGALGSIRHASVTWLVDSWALRNRKWSWKTDATQGGGVLTVLGTHFFYLTEWLFGPVSSVSAYVDSRTTAAQAPPGTVPSEDIIALIVKHRDGPIVFATIGNSCPGMSLHRWTISGELGSAVIENPTSDYMSGFLLRVREEYFPSAPSTTKDGRIQPFTRLARRFFSAVEQRAECTPSFGNGARVAALTELARKSASINRTLSESVERDGSSPAAQLCRSADSVVGQGLYNSRSSPSQVLVGG